MGRGGRRGEEKKRREEKRPTASESGDISMHKSGMKKRLKLNSSKKKKVETFSGSMDIPDIFLDRVVSSLKSCFESIAKVFTATSSFDYLCIIFIFPYIKVSQRGFYNNVTKPFRILGSEIFQCFITDKKA